MTISTITKVIGGEHAHGTVVTVEGLADQPEQRVGDDRWSFPLFSRDDVVRVVLPDQVYAELGNTLAYTNANGIPRPPLVKVTGRVDRAEKVPTLIAEEIVRLEVAS